MPTFAFGWFDDTSNLGPEQRTKRCSFPSTARFIISVTNRAAYFHLNLIDRCLMGLCAMPHVSRTSGSQAFRPSNFCPLQVGACLSLTVPLIVMNVIAEDFIAELVPAGMIHADQTTGSTGLTRRPAIALMAPSVSKASSTHWLSLFAKLGTEFK